jgi:selenocysteine lyase/cysteine desulfurase
MREKGFLIEELPHRASHLFGIRHSKKIDFNILKGKLQKANIHVSLRGDALRISPHVYNDAQDLNRLVKTLSAGI